MVTRAGANVKTKPARLSAAPVDDAAAREIIRRDLDFDAVAGDDADEVLAHAAGDVGDDFVPVVQLDAELRVGERLFDAAFGLDRLFLRHGSFPRECTEVRSQRSEVRLFLLT